MQRKSIGAPMIRLESITVDRKICRGRHMKMCEEQIRNDISELHLFKDLN